MFKLHTSILVSLVCLLSFSSKVNGESANEQDYVSILHVMNLSEIKVGNLARQNAKNKSAKAYGEVLVKEHSAADQELMKIARKLKLPLKTHASDVKETELNVLYNKLARTGSESFDREFATVLRDAHAEAITLVEKALATEKNDELRKHLDSILPRLKNHKNAAEKIAAEVK